MITYSYSKKSKHDSELNMESKITNLRNYHDTMV